MERPFKRRRVSLSAEQTLEEINAYSLKPQWNKYIRKKETNRGRERPLPKATSSGAFEGISLPLNPFEAPQKAPYPGNEIHTVLHPRNLTQRQSLVSPMSTVSKPVSQNDVQTAGLVFSSFLVPAASSAVVSNSGSQSVTSSNNPAIPSSSSPVLPFLRGDSSLVAAQPTQTSAAYTQALPSTFSLSSGQPASSSPSASPSRVTEPSVQAATGVASSTASSMILSLQLPNSQEVLTPSPSSPLPPSPESSLSSSSESASFFPSPADSSSRSNPTQSLSSRESQPAQNSKSLSTTTRENLSLSAFLSANARPTLTGASTISTGSSSSSSKPTSTNSNSSQNGSGTSSTPSTTLATSRASRTSAVSSRRKTSLSSSSRRPSKSTSTSSRSTSRPSSFTTSTTSRRLETLTPSPTITSGGTTGGAGGYGGASGTISGSSASSSTTAGAGAGAGAGDGSGGGGLTPTTRAVVGGVVGGLAGLSIILLLFLFLIRWRRNKALSRRPTFTPLPQSIPPGDTGQGSSMTERSSAVPLATGGFFKRLRPHSGHTAGTSDTGQSERGFQNFGGRKLESVLASRGDGYGEPGPSSATGPSTGFGSTASVGRGQGFGHSPGPSEPETLSGSSFYRDSQGFYGGKEAEPDSGPSPMVGPGSPSRSSPTYPHPPATGLPIEGLAGPSRATSEIAVMRPGPARTPVTNQPGFIPMRNPPRPPRSTPSPRPPRGTPSPRTGPTGASPVPRPQDELGRSHPSFDGSRGSRFTEEV